jgi:DNA-binding response OmpR family regulator
MANGVEQGLRTVRDAPDVVVREQPLPRILHVEDDPLVARAIASVLRRAGYDVVSASTFGDAVLALKRSYFDAIVSDFNLGGAATGADVLAFAGATPFMFLTSDDRADGLGVPRFDKPCAPAAIREALASLVRRSA